MEPNYKGPGLYRHYKGGEYEVLGCGQPEELGAPQGSLYSDVWEGGDLQVVYRPLTDSIPPVMQFWLRPLDVFNETVNIPDPKGGPCDVRVPRFEKYSDLTELGLLRERERLMHERLDRVGAPRKGVFMEGDTPSDLNIVGRFDDWQHVPAGFPHDESLDDFPEDEPVGPGEELVGDDAVAVEGNDGASTV